ncbi:DUF4270 domain-containing protein [Bacteroides sp. 224]|uniref:DUF4270 domain-containing protein n=1 Tax=Bacteroides sp. 224 TaxID=2302936 RepID=UPI0013D2E65D|nr:DUF4270 domain-containing protein [Bacteroides sp. 224]NDV64948.1 DUF4270 domain-containing protein [Bacteroides sp. 224]
MKTKFVWVMLLAISLFSCDDNTESLGLGVMPDGDKLSVATKTFPVTTESVLSDAVFAKTNIGYIGKYTDPEFGYYESSFLTQLNCVDNLKFPAVYDRETKTGLMAGDSIHLTELIISYDDYFGDSLNACHLNVYELNDNLDKNHYTNINPLDYYNPEKDFLAGKTYSAVDLSISESVRNNSNFTPYVRVQLPKEIGERIYRVNREHPEYFSNADAFIKNVFKGVYIESDLGDGTVLYANKVELNVVFPAFALDTLDNSIIRTSDGRDSIEYLVRSFVSTKEVIQANKFTNSDELEDKVKEEEWTYVKSPAGIFTKVTLPIQKIADELGQDTLNAVKLTFKNYAQKSDELFSMSAPTYLLLIREKDYKSFFEENKIIDNTTSYYATHDSSNNQYVFYNLARLIKTCITEKENAKKAAGTNWNEAEWDKENGKVLLVPVIINLDSNKNITSIQNDMKPGYVKLRGGTDVLETSVTYTYFAE